MIELVNHTSVRTSGDLVQSNVEAIAFPITAREAANSGGVYITGDIRWSISGPLLTREPKPRDRLTDGTGTAWVVLDWSYSRLTKEYQLNSRDLRIAADLRDLVDVYRPTWSADAAGSPIPSYAAVYSGLYARIQETDGQTTEERGKITTERHYTIYFQDTIEVTAEDQIRVDDVVYQVVSYADPDMIHALMGVNVVRKL